MQLSLISLLREPGITVPTHWKERVGWFWPSQPMLVLCTDLLAQTVQQTYRFCTPTYWNCALANWRCTNKVRLQLQKVGAQLNSASSRDNFLYFLVYLCEKSLCWCLNILITHTSLCSTFWRSTKPSLHCPRQPTTLWAWRQITPFQIISERLWRS